MIIVYLGLVIVLMTIDTAENRIVACTGVAFGAGIPLVFMLAAIDRKIHGIVIPCRRYPCIFVVALFAIGGELGADVIRIGSTVIIFLVATHTGIGSIAVSVRMALYAIRGNSLMSAR